eukprot:scaffold15436_cov221-Alexandrium_tamarense.AAC.6
MFSGLAALESDCLFLSRTISAIIRSSTTTTTTTTTCHKINALYAHWLYPPMNSRRKTSNLLRHSIHIIQSRFDAADKGTDFDKAVKDIKKEKDE